MIYFDGVGPQIQAIQHLRGDPQDFRVRKHGIVDTCNIEIALIKLPHAALGHCRLVTAIYFGDVVTFDGLDRRVHSKPASKGDSEIITEGADLTALVFEVVDKF